MPKEVICHISRMGFCISFCCTRSATYLDLRNETSKDSYAFLVYIHLGSWVRRDKANGMNNRQEKSFKRSCANYHKTIIVIVVCLFMIGVSGIGFNWILSRERLWNYTVLGTDTKDGVEWLGFYGALIGAAISGFISYLLLKKQVKISEKNLKIQLYQNEYQTLVNDISSLVGEYQLWQITKCSEYSSNIDITEEIKYISNLIKSMCKFSNVAHLKFSDNIDESLQEFGKAYEICASDFIDYAYKMIYILTCYKNTQDCNNFYGKVKKLNEEISEYNKESFQSMCTLGSSILSAKKEQLNRLINK